MVFSRLQLFVTFCFLVITVQVHAQLSVRPLPQVPGKLRWISAQSARTMGDSTQLQLPFWDDFSGSRHTPDSTKWFVSYGSPNVSPGTGINPPSINVAVFDGWDLLGRPYQATSLAQGEGDSLVSRFIDLAAVAPALRSTVFLSFFWQKEGRGEQPDPNDSLRLQFRSPVNGWVTVWSVKGDTDIPADRFFQEMVAINQPEYFHPYFQFRFQHFGRISGGYDTWNIDYIFVNSGRSAGDRAFDDRALTTLPTSFMRNYTAMPFSHFRIDLEDRLQPVEVEFYNLDAQVQPTEYSALIRDSSQVYDVMDLLTVLDPNPLGFERRTITSNPVNPDGFIALPDTSRLKLETVFYINSGDSIRFGSIDFRQNDTVRSMVRLDAELAYDDGTAEWAAGINQNGGQIAYRFIASKPDVITALKFYFPEFQSGNTGQSFNLVIWDNLREGVEGQLLSEQHIVQVPEALDQFGYYRLGRPVVISDTFYIGIRQNVTGFFGIGLDKNTDSGEEIFFNTTGSWEPNSTITGSLMMRPVFSFTKAVGLEDELMLSKIRLYPNPARSQFVMEGEFDGAVICDLRGVELQRIGAVSGLHGVEVQGIPPGLYLVRVHIGQAVKTFKLVLKP